MAITSESQIIDLSTIKSGCNKLRDSSESFGSTANSVRAASEICDATALSVDKNTFQEPLTQLANSIDDCEANIKALADAIESKATALYNKQRREYVEYLESIREKQN